MVGGRDVDSIARARGFNFAADVNETGGGRQAGSAFKPFALAAFIEEGKSLDSTFSGHLAARDHQRPLPQRGRHPLEGLQLRGRPATSRST